MRRNGSGAPVAVAALAAVLLPAAPAAAMTPSVVGWPVAPPAGELLPGVGGDGAVVNSKMPANNFAQVLVAYRTDLTLRWRTVIDLDDDNGWARVVTRRNPDGSYGPVGVFARRAGIWNVGADGRIRPGCFGPVLLDGECVEIARVGGPGINMRRRPPVGPEVWQVTVGSCCDLLQAPVIDGAGFLYSAQEGSGVGAFRLMSVDPASGGARWERTVSGQILTVLDRGVVISEPGGVLRAIGAADEDRWSATLPGGDAIAATADAARRQVLVQTRDGEGRVRVHAVSALTGAVLWSRPGTLMSVSPSGHRYVVRDDTTLVAYTSTGRARWTRTFMHSPAGVREQRDGTVLVSTETGLLFRLDPRRPMAAVTRSDVTVSTRRTRVPTFGAPWCAVGSGIVLRVRLATAATVRLRYRGFPTTVHPAGESLVVQYPLPAGERHLLLAIGAGPSTVRVDWRENGRLVATRFAVTGIRCPG